MHPSDRSDDGFVPSLLGGRPGSLPPWIGPLLEALSFWGAIALPVLYLPLLVVGIDDTTGLLAFLGLFGLHVLALIAGRSYRADSAR